MKIRSMLIAGSMLMAGAASVDAASVVYVGDLTPPSAQTGSAGGFSWFLDDGAGVQFWQFFATAGSQVTLRVDRLNANFDPALSIYQGVTDADTSLFDSVGDWGGMTYLASFDDENPAFLSPGPFGDPYGSIVIPATGLYTVAIGGNGSTDSGIYAYQVTSVPEPHVALLMVLGLAGLALLRRSAR